MAGKAIELKPDEARRTCDEEGLGFRSTADLPELAEIVGQDRAVEAIEFGMDIDSRGFNIYVLGPSGTGKTSTIRRFVEERAKGKPVPDDWCYVHNFADPRKPTCLRLPAGMGKGFRSDIDKLVSDFKTDIQQALEREDFETERNQIVQRLQEEQAARFAELEKKAREHGFSLQHGPRGVFVVPLVNGEAMSPDDFAKLPEDRREDVQAGAQELQEEVQKTLRQVRSVARETRERLQELERNTVLFAVGHNVDILKEKYGALPDIVAYLDAMKEDVVSNAQGFLSSGGDSDQQQNPIAALLSQQWAFLDRYKVNLIVDNSAIQGAPVIVESAPTYQNLIGSIERQAQFGMLTTNFSMIKPGALHRANGGYLILETDHLLRHPFSYEALKHSIENQEVKITDITEMLSLMSTASLEPQPIPLDVKVILIGHPMLYYLLFDLDEEFPELFKVKADFNVSMDRTEANMQLYARFLASHCKAEGCLEFDRGGVARIIEHASELVGDQTKLSTRFARVCDIALEAAHWAQKAGHHDVGRADVQRAIDAKTRRANRVEEVLQEMIERGEVFIDVDGAVVGQVNGLSVMMLGDYMFGKPSRITARTFMGRGRVVNIEREVKMSGPIHNKGVLILAGYLNGKYGQSRPLSLSASIGFEQLYEGVEGDSASSTELYALLSSLSGLPIQQRFAVTGSVNQRGEVQPIGGATQKIEGFFDVCKAKGLTGQQGVLIPKSNVRHLMLREEIVAAIRDGKFHIYPVETIDQGIELLTGTPAGELQPDGTYPEGTVNRAVDDRLKEYAERWKEMAAKDHAGESRDAPRDDEHS